MCVYIYIYTYTYVCRTAPPYVSIHSTHPCILDWLPDEFMMVHFVVLCAVSHCLNCNGMQQTPSKHMLNRV